MSYFMYSNKNLPNIVYFRYGVGMIYYKQEKFDFAEVHFRKALHINPHSAALLCHIGVVSLIYLY